MDATFRTYFHIFEFQHIQRSLWQFANPLPAFLERFMIASSNYEIVIRLRLSF